MFSNVTFLFPNRVKRNNDMEEQVIQPVITFVVIAAIGLVLFLAVRAIMLWYWRIDSIIENQEKQIEALKAILKRLTPQEAHKQN